MQRINLRKQKKALKNTLRDIRLSVQLLPSKVEYAYNKDSEPYEVGVNHYRRVKRLYKKTRNMDLVNKYINNNK